MKLRTLFRITVAALAMISASFLLMAALSGGSAGGRLATGRMITANSDSIYISSQFQGDTATIKTSGKTIVVAPSNIQIDGVTVATLDAAVADVRIDVKHGTIKFLADGSPVSTKSH